MGPEHAIVILEVSTLEIYFEKDGLGGFDSCSGDSPQG
jgi:hypothetical protein